MNSSVETNVRDAILLSLKTRLNQQTLETWFQPIEFEKLDTAKRIVVLRAPNEVVKDWVVTNYSALIDDTLRNLRLDDYSLIWLVASDKQRNADKPAPVLDSAPQQQSISFAAAAP